MMRRIELVVVLFGAMLISVGVFQFVETLADKAKVERNKEWFIVCGDGLMHTSIGRPFPDGGYNAGLSFTDKDGIHHLLRQKHCRFAPVSLLFKLDQPQERTVK